MAHALSAGDQQAMSEAVGATSSAVGAIVAIILLVPSNPNASFRGSRRDAQCSRLQYLCGSGITLRPVKADVAHQNDQGA